MIDFDVVTGPNPSEQPEKAKAEQPTNAVARKPPDGLVPQSAPPDAPSRDGPTLLEIPKGK